MYVAPWMGEGGELVLLAIKQGSRLALPPVTIPHGANRLEAADALWDLLERDYPDPRAMLRAI